VFSLFKEGSEDSTDHTSIRVGSLVGLNYEMFLMIVRMIHSDLKNFGFSLVLQMMMASSGARWWRNRVYMEFFANLHLIVNGVDKGVVESHIPYNLVPLYVVADVYGITKEIRIRQVHEVASLQTACKSAIMQNIAQKAVGSLPLPKFLKDFLLYR